MKLDRILSIAGQDYDVVEEHVILELSTAGRANFTAIIDDAQINPFDLVTFETNYSRYDTLQRLFLGYVESVFRVDSRQSRIFCRELSGVLAYPLPLSMRHPTLTDVLQEISDKTSGIEFAIPDQPYATTKIPHFNNIGSGYNALSAIGSVFKIEDYVWQQKDDGSIYVGAWADGEYQDLEVDDDLFDDAENQSATIIALPTLRPGMNLNGARIKQVEFSENTMQVMWF
jgi:hypothetical protein